MKVLKENWIWFLSIIIISFILNAIYCQFYLKEGVRSDLSDQMLSYMDSVKTYIKNQDSTISAINESYNNVNEYFEHSLFNKRKVYVGINNTLTGNSVHIYNDDKVRNLASGVHFRIRNHLNNYKPSVELMVIEVIERKGDLSKPSIFVSADMASMLGIITKDDKKLGAYEMEIEHIIK